MKFGNSEKGLMLNKDEIINLCKLIVQDYPGWEFSAGAFKNKKELKHSVKIVDPTWSFSPGSALMQPVAGFLNKEAGKVIKHIYGEPFELTSWVRLESLNRDYVGGIRFYDIESDKAEDVIRQMFDEGLSVLDKYYDFSSEENLLRSAPKNIEGQFGVQYCIMMAILGDYDFVRKYRSNEIKTDIPKLMNRIDEVMRYFNIV
ncbi:hypothetical protein [Rheinheimera oceanensis]|uniref:hypothetical protein n=1 Tax=Rheinheimera oceanensis TaxID=2817449 RepID=UPI001BFDC19E|nr:hypothetical protein [Rheinheimera oceanensis]